MLSYIILHFVHCVYMSSHTYSDLDCMFALLVLLSPLSAEA